MRKLGKGVYENDVETLLFDWAEIRFLSHSSATGAKNTSFGVAITIWRIQ